jgi:UDP-glucose 4-epimerase
MFSEIDRWKDAPLWDPASIQEATRTWFQYLGEKR